MYFFWLNWANCTIYNFQKIFPWHLCKPCSTSHGQTMVFLHKTNKTGMPSPPVKMFDCPQIEDVSYVFVPFYTLIIPNLYPTSEVSSPSCVVVKLHLDSFWRARFLKRDLEIMCIVTESEHRATPNVHMIGLNMINWGMFTFLGGCSITIVIYSYTTTTQECSHDWIKYD